MAGNKKRVIWRYLVVTIIALLVIFPFIYMVLHSFAVWEQVDRVIIPTKYTLRSWTWLFGDSDIASSSPWLRSFANTFIVATVSTSAMLFTSILVSYSIAKINFTGRRIIERLVIFQMFFPVIILLIPQFLLINQVGWIDTFKGMIVPTIISLWAIFMYTNFFKAIPNALIESAKIDGATDFQVLIRILLPMTKSITSVIFMFLYTERWITLLWDMLVSKSDSTITLNVLISTMFGPYGTFPGPMYGASVLLTLPLIIMFLLFSKNFAEGMDFLLK